MIKNKNIKSTANNIEIFKEPLKISTKSYLKITKMFISNIMPKNVSKYLHVQETEIHIFLDLKWF